MLLPTIHAQRSIAAGYVKQVIGSTYNVCSAHNVEQRHLLRHSQLVGQERHKQWRLAGMGWRRCFLGAAAQGESAAMVVLNA